MAQKIFELNSSAKGTNSVSRKLANAIVNRVAGPSDSIIRRDLTATPPNFLSEAWIGAAYTPIESRTEEQIELLKPSEILISEVEAADIVVIGVPMYNFGVPAVFKAWVDMIARRGRTFEYTEQGPKGLLTGKKTYVVISTGGTKVGSEIDFTRDYVRHILGFVGLTDVEFIIADDLDPAAAVAAANRTIEDISAYATA